VAIDCMACGGRVHETAVKCPHCGGRTGAAPSKPTAAEALAIAQLEERRFYNELEIASAPVLTTPVPVMSGFGALGLVVEAVAAATSSLDEPEPPAEVPRAIARERPRPPTVEPLASKAPEPAPPPGDQPRFLK
jgi:hypothetical protein